MLGRATGDPNLGRPRARGGSHPEAAPRPPSAVVRARIDLTGERAAPGGAGRQPLAPIFGDAPLRGAGGDPPPVVRLLRRRPRPRPRLPAVPREPVPRGVPSRRGPDPDAVPAAHPRPIAVSGGVARNHPRLHFRVTGRGAAWLARLTGGQKVAGSNPAGPTDERDDGDHAGILRRRHRPQHPVVRADRPRSRSSAGCRRTSERVCGASSCSPSWSAPTGSTATWRGGPAR